MVGVSGGQGDRWIITLCLNTTVIQFVCVLVYDSVKQINNIIDNETQAGEPRTERMAEDQDWTAVYPTAASFKPSAVPLPVRMGYPVKRGVPPAKKGNLELIKVIKS